MKNKKIIIFTVALLISMAIPASGYFHKELDKPLKSTVNLDELDQSSTDADAVLEIFSLGPAQSFIPTVEILTKASIKLLKLQGTAPYKFYFLEIRKDSIDSQTLTKKHIHRDDISTGQDWYEFDFPDIEVIPGDTYFILVYGETFNYDVGEVKWYYGYPDPYPQGDGYVLNYLQEWIALNEWVGQGANCDFCFKTYGIKNEPPAKPVVQGPSEVKINEEIELRIVSIDPEGEPLRYNINWNDGNETGWFGPFPSGEEIIMAHSWSEQDSYQVMIKSKDPFDEQSDQANHIVTVKKTKSYPFIKINELFRNHLIFYQLLKKIINL